MPLQYAGRSMEEYARQDSSAVLKELASSSRGLSNHEANKRLREFGRNVMAEKEEFNPLFQFLSHLTNPLVLILLFAAIVSAFMGEWTNAVIIAFVVLIGASLDFYQEYSGNNALKKLIESVRTTATVIRDGRQEEIRTSEIALGDIIFLSSGDMIPADARLVEAKDFYVNQSAITGESFPCEKMHDALRNRGDAISALNNMIFAGTNVVSGSATAIVVRTGKDTELGKTSAKLAEAPAKSEFERGVNNFGIFIMKLTFFLVAFIFLFNSIVKHDYFQSFIFAIAIAVGLTPECLPMIMSATMITGSKKMEKKGVIVKKLSAIPNFGSMNILCTDKTGTLTENRIELVKYTDYAGRDDERVLLMTYLNSAFQTGIKNPLDEAVMSFKKVNIKPYKKIDEVPYDFIRKRMSVVVGGPSGCTMITKGAPEEIFKLCNRCIIGSKRVKFDKKIRSKAMQFYYGLSGEGYRVLAVAQKKIAKRPNYSKNDEADMDFLGYVSFFDPPKKDVKSVIKELQELGVEVKVITGDNELITKKVCEEVGLEVRGILLGGEISGLTDSALRVKAENTTIFAKFSPADKSRVISVLKSGGNVVGYLGDGINDAPSLSAADVGISVNNAVDVAKESADLVLTKKSLHDIKEGIVEGRKTFGNTMKYVMMSLSVNFGTMFSAAGAIVFLPFLPMLSVQILLTNLLSDISQITIPTDNVDADWTQKPKKWNMGFIKKFMYLFGPVTSIFDFVYFFIMFLIVRASIQAFQTGWFIESIATHAFYIYQIRTKEMPLRGSAPGKLVLLSSMLSLIAGLLIPYTGLGAIFGFVPLPLNLLLIIAGIVAANSLAIEIAKKWFYKRFDF